MYNVQHLRQYTTAARQAMGEWLPFVQTYATVFLQFWDTLVSRAARAMYMVQHIHTWVPPKRTKGMSREEYDIVYRAWEEMAREHEAHYCWAQLNRTALSDRIRHACSNSADGVGSHLGDILGEADRLTRRAAYLDAVEVIWSQWIGMIEVDCARAVERLRAGNEADSRLRELIARIGRQEDALKAWRAQRRWWHGFLVGRSWIWGAPPAVYWVDVSELFRVLKAWHDRFDRGVLIASEMWRLRQLQDGPEVSFPPGRTYQVPEMVPPSAPKPVPWWERLQSWLAKT